MCDKGIPQLGEGTVRPSRLTTTASTATKGGVLSPRDAVVECIWAYRVNLT